MQPFDKDFVPSVTNRSWAGVTESLTYSSIFKASCRVCHISRKDTGVQFNSYSLFSSSPYYYGHSSACNTLQMPQSQRTWGVFWGSKAATRTGGPVSVYQPNFLKNLFNAHPDHAGDPALDCPD